MDTPTSTLWMVAAKAAGLLAVGLAFYTHFNRESLWPVAGIVLLAIFVALVFNQKASATEQRAYIFRLKYASIVAAIAIAFIFAVLLLKKVWG